jgi:hypothetical protein
LQEFPSTMTQIDKLELQNLKTILTSLKIDRPTIITQVLSDLNLSLTYESILIYRNLNELFLCVNTHQSIDSEDFFYIKKKLITQIDRVIGHC